MTSTTRIPLENVNHGVSATMQRLARLLSHGLAAWVILDVERHQRLRRQLAASRHGFTLRTTPSLSW